MITFKEICGKKASNAENFEDLCTLLIISKYPNAKQIDGRGGDLGVDTFIGEFEGLIHIFQHKYYLGKLSASQKKHITESFLVACIHHDVYEWTLCIPINFLPSEQKWFQNKLKEEAIKIYNNKYKIKDKVIERIKNANINYWGETKLLSILLKNDHLIRQFFNNTTFIDTPGSPPNIVLDIYENKWDQHNDCNFLSFSISNIGGRIAFINKVWIEVINVYQTKEKDPPWIGAVLKEYKINLTLNPNKKEYDILGKDLKLYYKNGDIDGFKIKITSPKGYIYKLLININWHDVELSEKIHRKISQPIIVKFPFN